jgi:glycosyltransferase involved in cell wall biosynthesis
MGATDCLFVLPEILSRQVPPVAGTINAGQLALAARRVMGGGWVSASARSGWWSAEQAIEEGSRPTLGRRPGSAPGLRRGAFAAGFVQTAKDLRRIAWNLGSRPTVPPCGPPFLVWQRLDPFFRSGVELARRYEVPLVLSVHSLVVSERRKWGAGRLPFDPVLRLGERWALRQADCICVVSETLVAELESLGVRRDDPRLLLTPNQVDVEHFRPRPREGATRRRELGIDGDDLVIGWAGSFRAFHRLDSVLDLHSKLAPALAARRISFLFVGDGPRRGWLEEACRAAGIRAQFPGVVSHALLPEYLSAMDVGLVLGEEGSGAYHYSPVKLRELLACGVPVVANDVGEVGALLATEGGGLLGSTAGDLASVVGELARDEEARLRLGREARAVATAQEGWEGQLRRVIDALGAADTQPSLPSTRR